MRALVTGGTGFIGNHLVGELRRKGWEVVCIVRRPLKIVDPGILCLAGDLLQPDLMKYDKSEVGKIDAVFHLGAMLPNQMPAANLALYLTANAVATSRLLEVTADWDIGSFVYMSSLTVIGKPEYLPVTELHPVRPSHPYLIGKLSGELACEMHRINERRNVFSLRVTSPYGPGMPSEMVVNRFVHRSIHSDDLICFGTGQRSQNFVHVDDVVLACLLAADSNRPGVYNIGGCSSINMKSLAELIVRLTPESRSQVLMGATPDPQYDYRWEVDLAVAKSGIRYMPEISLEQGISRYIKFIQSGSPLQQWWQAI